MVISKTPLRLSLLGGNTDFPAYFKKYGGAVITTTIDKYVYCILKKRFDNEIWVNYSVKEKVQNVDNIKHDLVREAMRLVWKDSKEPQDGIEITFLSDIPSEGSGLGSSSAVVVGLLNALHTYKNEQVTQRQLAEEACRIEINALSKPIGVQDQYAVAFGGFNLIEFGKDITVKPINPEGIEKYFMLFYTGVTRQADTILSQMKIDKEILDKIKHEVYQKLDHITDAEILGDLLSRYWVFKKQLNPAVTNEYIDNMLQLAYNNGALGGKIAGAGGGGFLLLVVPLENQMVLRKVLRLKELPFNLSRFGSRIIFNTL